MQKNEYRRALIMLRSLLNGYSGHARIEIRTLIGSMNIRAATPNTACQLRAVLVGRRSALYFAHPLGTLRRDMRGQATLSVNFDPRDVGGRPLESYSLLAIAATGGGECELVLVGNLNGSYETDWTRVQATVCALFQPGTPQDEPPIQTPYSIGNAALQRGAEAAAQKTDETGTIAASPRTAIPAAPDAAESITGDDAASATDTAESMHDDGAHTAADDSDSISGNGAFYMLDTTESLPGDETDSVTDVVENLPEDIADSMPDVAENMPGDEAGSMPDVDESLQADEAESVPDAAADENVGLVWDLSQPDEVLMSAEDGDDDIPDIFRQEGWRYTRIVLPAGCGYSHAYVGMPGCGGEVCVALPARFSPEPPVGLDDYAWTGGAVSGFWVKCFTTDEN